MRTAGKLVFNQNQELEDRTLDFKILCETINISNIQEGLEQVCSHLLRYVHIYVFLQVC